jgi:hypothetical protein
MTRSGTTYSIATQVLVIFVIRAWQSISQLMQFLADGGFAEPWPRTAWCAPMTAGQVLDFTIRYMPSDQWIGTDYHIQIKPTA